jgi:hypothetical protein
MTADSREVLAVQGCSNTEKTHTKNSKQIFPEKELCGLSPNFNIHVYVNDRSVYSAAGKYVNHAWPCGRCYICFASKDASSREEVCCYKGRYTAANVPSSCVVEKIIATEGKL